ncbi:hypothetical protein FRC11_001652 [Ceratobasidium sp. 423]|nr:hypothetical protein FRC11_001652 [Ceratobasidium sp. 423]
MASKDGSARRGPRPSADPLHIAKRKRLIAEEFAYNGSHSAIKKTISWGDIGRHGTGSPDKRPRTSLSQSITPGLSDMSTPTPMNRPRPALKALGSQKSILIPPGPRPSTQLKRESIGKPASISRQSQPEFTFRSPSGPPQRAQTQPEVINLISDETPRSDKNSNPPNNGDKVTGAPSLSAKQATQSQRIVDPPAPASPTSDAGTQYQVQDILDDDRPASPGRVPSPRPDSNVTASEKRRMDHYDPHVANGQSSIRSTSPSRRKRRTSEIGIQTIPDKEVDWLGDLDPDGSMSAVEISRVWAERRSGSKAADAGPDWPEPEPEEPLTGNFLDEFEGRSVNSGGKAPEDLDDTGDREAAGVSEEHDKSDEQGVEGQADDQEDVPGHAPASSRDPSPVANSIPPGQSSKPSTNAANRLPPASTPLRFPTSPPYESIPNGPQSPVRPYSFNLQEWKPASGLDRSRKDATSVQVVTQPRPFSSSQPNPFVTGPRARSRLYTPQPAPPTRNKNLNELRAAPTLGRSTLEGSQPAVNPAKSADASSRAESDDASKRSDSKTKSLKAAPTLGRSTDWGHVSPSRPATKSNKTNEPNPGHQPTDYDAEYGSVPEVPSSFPSRPPSSPAQYAWEVEPMHASTPHRLVTQMSPLAQGLTREDKSAKATSLTDSTQPSTLAALEKRRRSSIAPLAESKKIRREYDTAESSAVPNLRAHKDSYDESGQRTWVPKRPNMKRALDAPAPGVKKVTEPKYPVPVAEEPEPVEEARGHVPPESALESRAETFDPVSYGESMQEHQVELDEQLGQVPDDETGDKVPRPSTEIAETPQSTRIRDPFDLTTSELQSHRFASEQPERVIPPKPIDYAYVFPPNQPGASVVRDDEPEAFDVTQEGEPALPPTVEHTAPGSQVKSSQHSRPDGRPTKKVPSKSKRRSSGLHITPARRPVWSPPRTRLSMGGRSGISVLQVSKSDQYILVQAGLRPILKRLSQAHGFTVDVVAGVYQETGSLKDTEDTLEKMKHSAERMRVSISRRRSTLEVLHGEERDLTGRGSSEVSEANNDYLNWDTSRMSSRILFGEGL